MPEAMADPLKAAFIDVNVALYSQKLNRTRLFIKKEAGSNDDGTSSLGQRPKTSAGFNKEDVGRFHSASDAFFNSVSPRNADTTKPWTVVDAKDMKSSPTNTLRNTSMVSLDRVQSAGPGRSRKQSVMSGSCENINNHKNNSLNNGDKHQNINKDRNHHVINSTHAHVQSSNPVKPVIKDHNRFKSVSTNNIHHGQHSQTPLHAIDIVTHDQHGTKSRNGSPPRLRSAFAGSSRYRESIKDRISLNQTICDGHDQAVKRPKTAGVKKVHKENHSNNTGSGGKKQSNATGSRDVWSKFFDEKDVKQRQKSGGTKQKSSQAKSMERIDHQLDVTRVGQREENTGLNYRNNRNRSQSPNFIQQRTSNRSRSLSARRPESRLLPPSGKNANKEHQQDSAVDTTRPHSRVNSGRLRGRRSSVPYVKWKQQNLDRGSTPVEGMNGESLPPINSNRSESALSKRSSRESIGSANGSIPKGTVFKYDKPCRINVDDPMQTSENPNPVKRSHLSPASQKSGSSSNSKGQPNGYLTANSRNKSWTTADSTKAATLETLFEQKNLCVIPADRENTAVAESAIDSGYNSYNNLNGYSKNMKNHNKDRRGSIVSSTVNGKLSPSKRTQSFSNITNPSDNSNGKDEVFTSSPVKSSSQQNNKKPQMQRIRSENVLSVPQSNDRSSSPKSGNKSLRTNNNNSQTKSNGKPFSRTVSQPALLQSNDSELNAKNIKRNSRLKPSTGVSSIKAKTKTVSENDDGSDDGEKNDRIVRWLIGVETADVPPTPDITEEEPVQTDTAIHVVYNGD